MNRKSMVAVLVVSVSLIAAGCSSDSGGDAEQQDVIHIVADDGASMTTVVGEAELTRSADGLKATASVSDLKDDGVYTFWWLIGEFAVFPDVFVALGGSEVVGSDGKASVSMSVDKDQTGIEGFHGMSGTDPFHPDLSDIDLTTAEVHIEIAYHGQSADAGDALSVWQSDFWTGVACPEGDPIYNPGGTGAPFEVFSPPGPPQAHCPVQYAAVFAAS